MVRLEEVKDKLYSKLQENFNSSMVRLEGSRDTRKPVISTNFNSSMVRLEAVFCGTEKYWLSAHSRTAK